MTLFTLGAGIALTTTGELRYIGSLPPELTLDAEGTQLGQGPVLDQRLRAGLDLKSAGASGGNGLAWSLGTSWDLFSGQLAGDTWDVPGTIDERHREDLGVVDSGSFIPRKIAGDVTLGPVQVQAGLVTSHWGLGMLANDGAHDPEFGRSDFGDRVLRVRLASRPFGKGSVPFIVSLAGDRVVADETGTMASGQVAWQGIAAALYAPKSGNRLGVYGVYRDQAEPLLAGETEARRTRVGGVDVYAEGVVPAGAVTLHAGAEAAEIGGHTTRASSYNSTDGLAVLSGGATGFLGVADTPAAGATQALWSAKVRAGWASGDGNPDDGHSGDFTFDRDYDAGMLLFDEQAGAIEAANYALISDPEHTGRTPDGAESTVTEGSFRRGAFLQPVVEVNPVAWLGIRAGVMAAWSTVPVQQSFYTFRNGGTPTNHLDQPTSGYALGTELDGAIRVGGVDVGSDRVHFQPELLVQGAYLVVSPAMGGGHLVMGTATARARW